MPSSEASSAGWSRLSLRDHERSSSCRPTTSGLQAPISSAIGARSLPVSTALAMLNVITVTSTDRAEALAGAAASAAATIAPSHRRFIPTLWGLRGHPAELPAGHVEHLTVHEVRPRGAQEEDAAGRLLRRPGTTQRDQHRAHSPQLLGNPQLDLLAADLHHVGVLLGRGQAGLDEAERDGVDVDLELPPLLG